MRDYTAGKAGKGWPGTGPSPSSCRELSLSIAGKAALLPLHHPRDRWHFWSMVSHKAFQSTLLLHQQCFSEVLPHSHFRSRGQFHWRRVLFFLQKAPSASAGNPNFRNIPEVWDSKPDLCRTVLARWGSTLGIFFKKLGRRNVKSH